MEGLTAQAAQLLGWACKTTHPNRLMFPLPAWLVNLDDIFWASLLTLWLQLVHRPQIPICIYRWSTFFFSILSPLCVTALRGCREERQRCEFTVFCCRSQVNIKFNRSKETPNSESAILPTLRCQKPVSPAPTLTQSTTSQQHLNTDIHVLQDKAEKKSCRGFNYIIFIFTLAFNILYSRLGKIVSFSAPYQE